MIRKLLFAVCCLALAFGRSFGQTEILVDIHDIYPEETRLQGFVLDADQRVQINAAGVYQKDRKDELILGTTWILNADTREVVWKLEPADHVRHDDYEIQRQSDTVFLRKGAYEAYYACYPYFQRNDSWGRDVNRNVGHLIRDIVDGIFDHDFDSYDRRRYNDLLRDFEIVVRGNGRKLSVQDVRDTQEALKRDAIVSLPASRPNSYEKQGFELLRPVELQIYALGEAREDGAFDYGWILDTQKHRKVWQLDYRHSEHAGGADKNRVADEVITLPPGRYAAMYVTDDSHSPEKWNAPPPYDLAFWGLTISVADPDLKPYIKEYDYSEFNESNVILSLTPLRDDEFRSRGFWLRRPMDLQIYAIGEGRDGEMYDYGWIVDAHSHKKVWEMDYDDTEHAGGGQKNRLYDRIVHLDEGRYVAYFVTDGSHAYRDWNTSPPYDRRHYGMTVIGTGDRFSAGDVTDYDETEDPSILARIVGVRDDAYRQERFTLDKNTRVRIYAIGEGRSGRMYDYGWIEDANTGRVVWEMSYRMTDHAGGARKNRVFNGRVHLDAGDYKVYYESDGSHSFNDWNASPPDDPLNWGITVERIGEP